jgi:hypothetical protein
MGTFAETANVDYHLSFAEQEKRLPFSVSSVFCMPYIYMCVCVFIYMYVCVCICISVCVCVCVNMYPVSMNMLPFQTEKGKLGDFL